MRCPSTLFFIGNRDFIQEKRELYKGSKAAKATKGLQRYKSVIPEHPKNRKNIKNKKKPAGRIFPLQDLAESWLFCSQIINISILQLLLLIYRFYISFSKIATTH